MYGRILLAIDATPTEENRSALTRAEQIGRLTGTTIHVLHVGRAHIVPGDIIGGSGLGVLSAQDDAETVDRQAVQQLVDSLAAAGIEAHGEMVSATEHDVAEVERGARVVFSHVTASAERDPARARNALVAWTAMTLFAGVITQLLAAIFGYDAQFGEPAAYWFGHPLYDPWRFLHWGVELAPVRPGIAFLSILLALIIMLAAFATLALVVHEMMTNSAKYGALADSTGQVEIVWKIDNNSSLVIDWKESGGPPVQPPSRRGFGTTIIERSIPFDLKGDAELRFDLLGVHAHFTIPA